MTEGGSKPCHRKSKICKFKELDRQFRLNAHRKVDDTMVEVVALPVALQDVGEFWVVDVMDLVRSESIGTFVTGVSL